ncbi:hypothetical protein [Seonamhaeicola marinus]|uniref:STAS/SEC14 domain-containing protein n=1 Tax=Seonamhaeicola marinus TaxID=1912246 RepID=A0A5D0HJV1_9FLAO|nr:hypothetical protein [Seonamhaeicola marinus]TYA71664.1 hypothetical protein FUA24_19055 [Seonamhaeicola marinus]
MENKKFGTFKILERHKLIVEYYKGHFELSDSFYVKKIETSDSAYSPDYNLIVDFREAKIALTSKDVLTYVDFVKSQPQMQGNRKTAFLINTPKEAAITTLYSNYVSALTYIGEVFSTEEAALKWLKLKDVDLDMLHNTFKVLKAQKNIF